MEQETLLVNIFGAPGAGKSSFAHGLVYKLKCAAIDCELASEYAKDIFYEESPKKLSNQIYIFGKQLHRITRILGKVKILVTDAPLLHSIHYDARKSDVFKQLVLEEHRALNNLNIFLTRKHAYIQNGRFQNEEGSLVIHNSIQSILEGNDIIYHEIDATADGLDKIFDLTNEYYNLLLQDI